MIGFLVAWSALGTAAAVLLPLLAPAILVLSVVVPVALADKALLGKRIVLLRMEMLLLLFTAGYMAINSTWSLDKGTAMMAVAMVVLAALVLHAGATALPLMQPRHLEALAKGFLLGFGIAAFVLFCEYATRMSGQRALEHFLADAGVRNIRIGAGTWDAPNNTPMTRNLTVAMLLLWPAVLVARQHITGWKRQAMAGLLVLLVGSAVLLSPSATAKIGMAGGIAAVVLAAWSVRFVLGVLTAFWGTMCLAVVPIATFLYSIELHKASWLHPSGRHRIAIWGATSDWYWRAPFFGSGVATARGLEKTDAAHAGAIAQFGSAGFLNWHSHNGYLQVWFEAGLVGGILMFVLGLLVLQGIKRTAPELQAAYCGSFACFALVLATGFSIWAAWYLSAFAIAVISAQLTRADFSSRAQSRPC